MTWFMTTLSRVSVMHLSHLYQEHLRCCDSCKQSSTLCLVQFKCISSSQVSLKYLTDHRLFSQLQLEES